MKGLLQYKNVGDSGIIKDVDMGSRTVTGYFSKFLNKDSDGDIMMPGCFSKSIQEWGPSGIQKIRHLAFHDSHKALSRPHVLREDSFGLYFESTISETSYGKDVLILYRDGVINEHSIGFRPIKSRDNNGAQEFNEVQLWEGSTVTWGANGETPFMGMKSITKEYVASQIDRMQKALKLAGLTDDTYIELEYALEQLKAMPLTENEPGENHSEDNQPDEQEIKSALNRILIKQSLINLS